MTNYLKAFIYATDNTFIFNTKQIVFLITFIPLVTYIILTNFKHFAG